MILISLIYIVDYAANEKYAFEMFAFYNKTSEENKIDKMLDDEKFNLFLDISI